MNLHLHQLTPWHTASLGGTANTSPMELQQLGHHVQQCSHARNRLFLWRSGVGALHQGLLARFVTTLTVAVALLGMAVIVW